MAKKKAVAAPAPRPAPKPINQRGAEYQAEKLTGNRAVQGKLPTGGPRYVYEVKWAGINPATKKSWPCSFEPAGCLIGWEAKMKAVDAAIESKKNGPQLNPVKEALAAREAAAKEKAEELRKKRERLQRRQVRRRARDGSDADGADDDDSDSEEDEPGEAQLTGEELAAELARLAQLELLARQTLNAEGGPCREQLEQLFAAFGADAECVAAAAQAVAAPAAPAEVTHKREGRSRVWVAFDRSTHRCKLHTASGQVCGKPPKAGSGTSGFIRHLEEEHPVHRAPRPTPHAARPTPQAPRPTPRAPA